MGYGYYLNDPRFWRGVIDVLDASWEATEKRFAKYNKLNKNIMEEKKTKKMTKAEAFEWLKCKKVNTIGLGEEVQKKLFDCGVKWANGKSEYYDFGDYLLIENNGDLYHCGNCGDSYFRMHHFEEISADDILSIEIVEEKKEPLDRWEEFASKVAKIQETLEDDEVCIITKTNYLTMTK